MINLSSLPLHKKFLLVLILICGSALTLATLGFVVNDWISSREETFDRLNSQAAIIGNNSSAALLFNDRQSAQLTLQTLQSEEDIVGAFIFDNTEKLFASYVTPQLGEINKTLFIKPFGIIDSGLYAQYQIRLDNEFVGTVQLISSQAYWQDKQLQKVWILFFLFLGSIIVAVVLSNSVQHIIIHPLLQLTRTARKVTETRDYSLRAEKSTQDEIGRLTDDFNEMLNQIQRRDIELREARDSLEDKVKARTAELEALTERLEHQAYHDHLTGLANRVSFDHELTSAINFAKRHDYKVAVLFLDLDRFKSINDSLGHHIGDQLLINLSRKMINLLRESDVIARLGGDEFAILIKDASLTGLMEIAHKLTSLISQPITVESYKLQVSTSVGISFYPDDGDNASVILKNADTAMYSAKENGRNQFNFFSQEMNNKTERRLLLEHKLRDAVFSGAFKLFYQPKWSIENKIIVGVEALIRWNDPAEGYISPAEFIPLAEDCGLIGLIDDWVLRTACTELLSLQELSKGISLAINVSPANFIREDIHQNVTTALEETLFPAEQLELEVTETVVATEMSNITEQLTKLRQLGVHIAIDDFGIAYSSLSRLTKLPLNTLKIDRSFISDIGREPEDEIVIRTIIDMAHNLNLSVVAEGVETEEQYAFVKDNHCDIVQGFLLSKPMPLEQLKDELVKQQTQKLNNTVLHG